MNDDNDDASQDPNSDYDVGYCRPPKRTQFKPGKSGNPKGRKRKPKSLQAQMQKAVAKKVRISEGGKTKLLPLEDVITKTLVNNAAKGDLRAISLVFKVLNAPEFAETEIFDQNKLSPDDQAMLDQMMSQLSGPESSDSAPSPDPTSEDAKPEKVTPPSAMPAPRNHTQIEKDDSHDE
ncbi:MAG: DUF5681 domain-containing protein [Litoreibacter sp.]